MQSDLIDADLIERFSKGDRIAFGVIYNHYHKAIKTNISKVILEHDIVEDILQDVFFKLWEARHRFNDVQSLSGWLFRVSYNTSITYIRGMLKDRKYILPGMLDSIDAPAYDDSAINIQRKEGLLHEAIRILPPRKKQVIDLCKFQDKTYAEAGSILGIEKDTVKEYMTASLKFIKRYILSKNL